LIYLLKFIDKGPELENIYSGIKKSFDRIEKEYHPNNMVKEACAEDFIEDEKILKTIRERLVIREDEKTMHGEVFTPPELICEMLNTLPKSVWANKDLKWLDPANGIGNYPIVVYYKLLQGLKHAIPDQEKRSKHIIENMLYMVELDHINVNTCRKLFKILDPKATPNIARANFLEEENKWKKALGNDKYDIIMGNPPYNEGGVRAKGKSHESSETKTLWPLFVKNCLNYLRDKESYLLFIHPGSWVSLNGANGDLMTSRQLVKLRFYDKTQSGFIFGLPQLIPTTYQLIKNQETKKDTLIYDNCYNKFVPFNIYENGFVPTESVELMRKIYEKTKKYGSLESKYISVRNSTELQDNYSLNHPYPVVSITDKKINVLYSKTNNCKTVEKKLVLPSSYMGYPLLDTHGILYPVSTDHGILISNNNEKELKLIQSFFYTNLVLYIINITKSRMSFFNNKIFQILPDITKFVKKPHVTDKDLINLFDLKDTETKCYDFYSKGNGQGHISPELIKSFSSFDLTKTMTKDQIMKTKELMTIKPQKGGMKTRRRAKTGMRTRRLLRWLPKF
tara:strand:+ start:7089 stop:8783 length:1695 start_codon:yes stop_codon:yes gene_type:complete